MFCEVRLRTAMCDIYCLSFDFYDFRSSPVSQLSCKFLSDLQHFNIFVHSSATKHYSTGWRWIPKPPFEIWRRSWWRSRNMKLWKVCLIYPVHVLYSFTTTLCLKDWCNASRPVAFRQTRLASTVWFRKRTLPRSFCLLALKLTPCCDGCVLGIEPALPFSCSKEFNRPLLRFSEQSEEQGGSLEHSGTMRCWNRMDVIVFDICQFITLKVWCARALSL